MSGNQKRTINGYLMLGGMLMLASVSGCSVYNVTSEQGIGDLMLKGYDPVSYRQSATPSKGSHDIHSKYKYGTYLFINEANREAFDKDPARFVPQYGGFCAKGVSYAIRAGGTPTVFEIRDGRLFIFENRYAREYWLTDPPDFIAKADHYWDSELKDAPVKWTNFKRFFFRVPHYRSYPEEFADFERRTGRPPPFND